MPANCRRFWAELGLIAVVDVPSSKAHRLQCTMQVPIVLFLGRRLYSWHDVLVLKHLLVIGKDFNLIRFNPTNVAGQN